MAPAVLEERSIIIQKYDSEARSTTRPILFIHGPGSSTAIWEPIIPLMRFRTRITFDLPGHGQSAVLDEPLTPKSISSLVSAILTRAEVEQADVVAHAGGCSIAIQFALDYPEMVARLVLMGPPPLPVATEKLDSAIQAFRSGNGFETWREMIPSLLGEKSRGDEEILQKLKVMTDQVTAEGLIAFIECMKGCHLEPGMLRQQISTSVVRGREDTMSSAEVCAKMAELTGGMIVEVDTGHFFTLEDPQLIAKTISEIL
ncbi:Alpha/Beta hydrolase protein [Mycena floridula]|nr:Alpha/Beta hydrolase protein [Mycena floridula]